VAVQWHPTIAEIGFAVLLALVPWGASLPVVWKSPMWFVAWLLALHILFTIVPYLAGLPVVVKLSLCVGLTGFLIACSYFPLRALWREEKAASLEGDLLGAGEVFNDDKARVAPWVQIGDSDSIFVMVPPKPGEQPQPYFQPFPDAEFRVEFGKKGPLVSTVIRDSEGHTVLTIDRNHWKVYPPFCQDKNYTENTLEVLDSSGHVVLQLRLLPQSFPMPLVQIQAEWWDNQGNGVRIMRTPGRKNGQLSPLGPKITRNESLIKPVFEYPSAKHWGELIGQNSN